MEKTTCRLGGLLSWQVAGGQLLHKNESCGCGGRILQPSLQAKEK